MLKSPEAIPDYQSPKHPGTMISMAIVQLHYIQASNRRGFIGALSRRRFLDERHALASIPVYCIPVHTSWLSSHSQRPPNPIMTSPRSHLNLTARLSLTLES